MLTLSYTGMPADTCCFQPAADWLTTIPPPSPIANSSGHGSHSPLEYSHSPSSYYQLCSKDMNLGSYHLCEYSQPGYLRQGSDEIERLSNDWCSVCVCVCVCVTSCCRWHRNAVPLLSGLSSSMTWYETMCPIRYDVVYQWNAVSLVQLLDRRNCCMV